MKGGIILALATENKISAAPQGYTAYHPHPSSGEQLKRCSDEYQTLIDYLKYAYSVDGMLPPTPKAMEKQISAKNDHREIKKELRRTYESNKIGM